MAALALGPEGAADGTSGRIRLSPAEAQWLRYVLCDWEGDGGVSSSFGAQMERLAQNSSHRETTPAECIYVHGPKPCASRLRWPHLLDAEQYMTKLARDRREILSAYRALCLLGGLDCAVLVRLYGPRPPGLPDLQAAKLARMWEPNATEEYLRVCRFAPHAMGGWAQLAPYIDLRGARVAKAKESHDARRERIRAFEAARMLRLGDVGVECEGLIRNASLAYRDTHDWLGT